MRTKGLVSKVVIFGELCCVLVITGSDAACAKHRQDFSVLMSQHLFILGTRLRGERDRLRSGDAFPSCHLHEALGRATERLYDVY